MLYAASATVEGVERILIDGSIDFCVKQAPGKQTMLKRKIAFEKPTLE